MDKQEAQDKELAAVKAHHEEDIHAIKDELTLIMYGLLAALQGLQEQGCDGPVTDAVDKINKHLNKRLMNKEDFPMNARTLCQSAVAAIGTTAMLQDVNWLSVASTAALAAVLSILNSVATGLPEVE